MKRSLTMVTRDPFWGGIVGTKDLSDMDVTDAVQAMAGALELPKALLDQLWHVLTPQVLYDILKATLEAQGGTVSIVAEVKP